MNFYQKIISVITLVVIGITLSIAWVCFNAPYTNIFITECVAIVWAELLLGVTLIILSNKTDSKLPYSMSFGYIILIYLLFTLIMIYPACQDTHLKTFILSHSIGFATVLILCCIFMLGEHNIKRQEDADRTRLAMKKNSYLQIKQIMADAQNAFTNDFALLKDTEKMADHLRYASDSRIGMENIDIKIMNTLSAMQIAVAATDAAEYKSQLKLLLRFFNSREELAKLS